MRTTTSKLIAPRNCNMDEVLLLLSQMTTVPANSAHIGINVLNPLSAASFIASLPDSRYERSGAGFHTEAEVDQTRSLSRRTATLTPRTKPRILFTERLFADCAFF